MPKLRFKKGDRIQEREPTGWVADDDGGPTLRQGTVRAIRVRVRYLIRWDDDMGPRGSERGEDSIVLESPEKIPLDTPQGGE